MAIYGRMVYLFQMYRIIQSRRSQDERAAGGSCIEDEAAVPHVDSYIGGGVNVSAVDSCTVNIKMNRS